MLWVAQRPTKGHILLMTISNKMDGRLSCRIQVVKGEVEGAEVEREACVDYAGLVGHGKESEFYSE